MLDWLDSIPHQMRLSRTIIRTMSSSTTCAAVVAPPGDTPPLTYRVTARCSTSKARVGVMRLRHSDVDTPVFMPVGTQVTSILERYIHFKYKPHVLVYLL